MINIQWDKKFELGHEKIDFEHRIFLDLIRTASHLGQDKQRANRILNEIKKYAEFHFISEENVMLDANYPDYTQHKAEHNQLLAQLNDMIFQHHRSQIPTEELVDFLFQWFALHTTQVDSKLTLFIQGQS